MRRAAEQALTLADGDRTRAEEPLLALPLVAAESAAAHWPGRNLGELPARPLSRREFDQLTRKLNGGLTGADERWAAYNRMLGLLAPSP